LADFGNCDGAIGARSLGPNIAWLQH